MAASSIVKKEDSLAVDFSTVFSELKPQMALLDVFLREQMTGLEPEIREMAEYCIDTAGKRIRPALVFLSGATAEDRISDQLVRVAAVVELVHLATLVHDDIMDDAEMRRNKRTASRSYGPEAAVLLGDALFSHALNLATQFPTTEVCAEVSDSTRKVCAGEIIQTLRRGSTNITEQDYRRVIDLKTAELFRVSCSLGSRIAGYPSEYVRAASVFGRHLGIAYQIYDDLADFFGSEVKIGKTLGTDLISGKITLPLLELMKRLSEVERGELIEEIVKKRAPQLTLRIQQMNTLGVFRAVAEAIERELSDAEAQLSVYTNEPPTAKLLCLCGVLRAQVAMLTPPTK